MSKTKHVALISGATGAIGSAIAQSLAEEPGFEVVLLCRNEKKAASLTKSIQQKTKNMNIRYELADLSSKHSVSALAERWAGQLDVLVNNAAVAPSRRTETADGLELQFAVNVLGYYWTTELLKAALASTPQSRVINVASYWAGELDTSDLQFKKRRYNNNTAYRQSKQANRMLSTAFASRLAPLGIAVNAAHPGDVCSTLSSNLGFGGHESPAQGASTPVWLATSPAGVENSGKYFEQMREVECRFSRDRDKVDELFELCGSF